MSCEVAPPRLTIGAKVRINGRPFVVGKLTEGARVFACAATGDEWPIGFAAQIVMMREMRLVSEADWRTLDWNVRQALETDWGAFTDVERLSAMRKAPFVQAVDALPAHRRDRRAIVEPLTSSVAASAAIPFDAPPTFRSVRKWYRIWIVAGRDIRALVDFHSGKGNRTSRLPDWVREEIEAAIDETYATDPPGSKAAAQERAAYRVQLRAERDRLPLPVGAKEIIGRNVAARAIAGRDQYELATVRLGKPEADRLFDMVGAGPHGTRPLGEVEVDHTQVDVILVDEAGRVLGRPYLTVLIDRWSRMIIGFSLSFQPPSWVSVMDALQMSVLPKSETIARICRDFEPPSSDWDVFGAPDVLFVDRGAEFRSVSMRATESALNMRIVDLLPGTPKTKGRNERFFGKANTRLFHRLPGTTFSNVVQRRRNMHDAEKQASTTLAELKWMILTWIVDIYALARHSVTRETPAERWRRGIREWGPKPPPPAEIIRPLTGLTPLRKLNKDGVRFETLRWNSNAFQALRARGGGGDVVIRIDPLDLAQAWVLDEAEGVWIAGDLVSGDDADGGTLAEWRRLRRVEAENETFDVDVALTRAKADQRIRDRVDAGRRPSPKKKASLRVDGRKAAEHVRPDRYDPDASAAPLGSHDMAAAPLLPVQDARGPWRETVRAPVPHVAEPRTAEETAGAKETDDPAEDTRPSAFAITRRNRNR